MKLNASHKTLLLVGIGGLAVYHLFKSGAQAVNPFNQDNVINQGFNELYDSTGDSTLGTDIYDWLHYDIYDENGDWIRDENIAFAPFNFAYELGQELRAWWDS